MKSRLLTRFEAIALAAAVFLVVSPAAAGGLADAMEVVAATLRADGTTNTWTRSELADALGLMNRRYWRDMETAAGRIAWHGAVVSSTAVTNAQGRLMRRDTYADGYVHETAARVEVARPKPIGGGAGGAAARIARLEARIATNTAEMAAMTLESLADGGDAAERYARLAVERRRLARMLEREKAKQTNLVAVTVMAGGAE